MAVVHVKRLPLLENAAGQSAGAPGSEDPALIKSNQDTKLGQARSEEPAPTKLNDQHDAHVMQVSARTMACRADHYRLVADLPRRAPGTAR